MDDDWIVKIYVAHSLELRDWVADEIFTRIPEDFEILDPFESRRDEMEGLDTDEEIRMAIREKYDETPRWVVKHDLDDIDTSDAMIVINNGGPSYGSVFETFYMAHVLDRPVFMLVESKYKNHPWLNFYCCCVTDDIDNLINSLLKYYNLNG